MNDEIKEILQEVIKIIDNTSYNEDFTYFQVSHISKLLDYITNLQQAIEVKNERIKEEQQEKERYIKIYNELNIWNKKLQQENERLKLKYKSQKNINQKLLSLDIKHKKINGELRERIAYLERSNDRREDTILGLRQEINDVEDKNSKLEITLQNIQEDYDRRVKEIDVLKKKLDKRYYKNEYKRLEQENQEMKTNNIPTLKHNIDALVDEVDELEDYKSRCEKASDKIQYIIDYGFDYDVFNTVESLKGLIDMLVDYARESKKILQGENNE